MRGADHLAPVSSKRKECMPYTLDFISAICSQLCLNLPFNAEVWPVSSHASMQLLELVSSQSHSLGLLTLLITLSNLQTEVDQNNLKVTVLHVPHIKAAPIKGEYVFWGWQHGPTDPYEAMDIHLQINKPSNLNHLFS